MVNDVPDARMTNKYAVPVWLWAQGFDPQCLVGQTDGMKLLMKKGRTNHSARALQSLFA